MVNGVGVASRGTKGLHTIEQHNYYIGRRLPCPYCLRGSEPVHKSLLLEKME